MRSSLLQIIFSSIVLLLFVNFVKAAEEDATSIPGARSKVTDVEDGWKPQLTSGDLASQIFDLQRQPQYRRYRKLKSRLGRATKQARELRSSSPSEDLQIEVAQGPEIESEEGQRIKAQRRMDRFLTSLPENDPLILLKNEFKKVKQAEEEEIQKNTIKFHKIMAARGITPQMSAAHTYSCSKSATKPRR